MISAQEVAKYFLYLAEANNDDEMSNLKLQKLLYYAQGFHLAILNKPLFAEPIEAWIHGPVVPPIYRAYKNFGNVGIPYANDLAFEAIPEESREILDEVYEVYGPYSATALRNMTHNEPPWKGTPQSAVITNVAMKAFFLTRIIDDGEI